MNLLTAGAIRQGSRRGSKVGTVCAVSGRATWTAGQRNNWSKDEGRCRIPVQGR